MKKEKKIRIEIEVNEFGPEGRPPLKLYFDPKEVKEAKNGEDVLKCLKHLNGNMPYSSMRCRALAEKSAGKALTQKIRGICEGGSDKGKSPKGRRSSKVSRDPGVEV